MQSLAIQRRAFTLVELLVVIAIIAVLASLILAGVSKAKATAQSAKCRNNLRQIGIANTMYVGDEGGYPMGMWFKALAPYGITADYGYPFIRVQLRPSSLSCPTANYSDRISQISGAWETDYGFNSESFEMPIGDHFGLGPSLDWKNPVLLGENRVAVPSDMISYTDAFYRYSYAKRVLDAGYGPGSNGNYNEAGGPWGTNGTKLAYLRHNSRLNSVFCDSHVEGTKVDRLYFSNRPTDRRRWFRDNNAHLELALTQ